MSFCQAAEWAPVSFQQTQTFTVDKALHAYYKDIIHMCILQFPTFICHSHNGLLKVHFYINTMCGIK